MKRNPRRLLKITGVIIASGLLLLAILALANLILTASEKSRYQAPGKLVAVDGKEMHIYSEGSGTKNVILLSGWGTAGPVLDFKPMIKALKESFRVTVVESFGYGWSDWTNTPRTNENVLEETRRALKEAGIFPPYILVPHSISGIYVLFYANRYPDEIEAIIGLDSTVPEQSRYWQPDKGSIMPRVLRVTGILRLMLLFTPRMVGYDFPGYSDADRQMISRMYLWNYGNRSQMNERMQNYENARQLLGDKFPAAIPVSMILSRESMEQIPTIMPGLDWAKAHEDQMTGTRQGRIYVAEGGHYIHWTNSEKVAAIVKDTISRETGR